ncbi:MAG: hypothetical protein MHPDNHAH_03461 [Anaerolineales bacterium]|nr:hypothetical protein [Anaerolineales bacterium]
MIIKSKRVFYAPLTHYDKGYAIYKTPFLIVVFLVQAESFFKDLGVVQYNFHFLRFDEMTDDFDCLSLESPR